MLLVFAPLLARGSAVNVFSAAYLSGYADEATVQQMGISNDEFEASVLLTSAV